MNLRESERFFVYEFILLRNHPEETPKNKPRYCSHTLDLNGSVPIPSEDGKL